MQENTFITDLLSLWKEIIGGLLVMAIIYWYIFLKKKLHAKFCFYLFLNKKAKTQLKELKKSKRDHPVARNLMYFIAKQSGIHLFSHNGEDVSLSEYAEILHRSIDSNTNILKELFFIELTLPSTWYHQAGENPERGKAINIIREYFEQQKNLKREKGNKVILKRYLVVKSHDFEADSKKKDFIKEHIVDEHTGQKIELYLCPLESLPAEVKDKVKDTTIFIDEKGKGWVIEGLNFDMKSLEEPSNWIRVRIEDREEQIRNYYRSLIRELEKYAIPKTTK